METAVASESRRLRKQQRTREALIDAAYHLMAEHGPDNVTMLQIAEHADLGAGTVYNYFTSKDELAVAVMDKVYLRLAERIHEVTNAFDDPVDVCVYAVRATMITAASSPLWARLMSKAVVAAEVMFRLMGPSTIADLEKARETGRAEFADAELTWRLMTHALIGFGLEVRQDHISVDALDESLISLLGILGIPRDAARIYAAKDWPPLPKD